MVTAVSAQPEEPMVSTGSVPSSSCAHTGERWVNTGTVLLAASAGRAPPAPAATSRMVHVARTRALLTAPSYEVLSAKSSVAGGRFGPLRDRDFPLAGQKTLEVAGVAGQGQADVEHLIDADGPVGRDRLIENRHGLRDRSRRLDHDQTTVLAVATGNADDGLEVRGRDQGELAIGQAVATARTLVPCRLAAQDFQKIHVPIHTPMGAAPSGPSDNGLTSLWGNAGGLLSPPKIAILGRDAGPAFLHGATCGRPARLRPA